MSQKVKPKNLAELKQIIEDTIQKEGEKCNLNFIDVSSITDFNHLFEFSDFNGNISEWDVSNATDMSYMFYHSQFNGNISNWNVSNTTDMRFMFFSSQLLLLANNDHKLI